MMKSKHSCLDFVRREVMLGVVFGGLKSFEDYNCTYIYIFSKNLESCFWFCFVCLKKVYKIHRSDM